MNKFHLTAPLLLLLLLFASCTEQVDYSARYTFTEKTVWDYLIGHEQYSEYCTLLAKTPVSNLTQTTIRQLLSARGHYTVFAPTNEALQAYLDSLAAQGKIGQPSWEGFESEHVRDSVQRLIVFNSIIDSGDDLLPIQTWDFTATQDGEIVLPNMAEHKLVVHYGTWEERADITVNGSPIDERNRDIPLLNGTIHCVQKPVLSSENRLGDWLQEQVRERRLGFYVSSMLVLATGLRDTLNAVRDERYEDMKNQGLFNHLSNYPEHRKYGYTLFAETDELWSQTLDKPALDITVQDVVEYLAGLDVYPEAKNDGNYKDQDNLLNRFVTYHLLNRRLAKGYVVNHYNELGYDINTGNLGIPKMQYYYTMGHRRLMKLYESAESNGVYINRCPILDNARRGTYHEIYCEAGKEGVLVEDPNVEGENNLVNAMVYPISKILLFDRATRENLGKERMRFDVASISPELTNGDIRMNELMDDAHMNRSIPADKDYPFLMDIRINEGTTYFKYQTARMTGWMDFEGDEVKFEGYGDCTIKLPPVPTEDVYELRYRVSCQPFFGMHQIYFGTDPEKMHIVGIPIDLRRTNTSVGWEEESEDDDYNAELEKRMRNHDAMPGVKSHSGMPGSNFTERKDQISSRRILVRERMSPDQTYYLRMKLCLDYPITLFMDYLELCPKAVYDNPESPEDPW
ncbi:MAG: fasciclin domain-containing protein [Bacteroidaceae bacterium]|nr:fasciclin domain-containing protein [Bacteroidaceae bacterium]